MILLSFDIEEFDAPMEYGADIYTCRQFSLSVQGLERILNLLNKHEIKATFFITANFALHCKDKVQLIASLGHEIASHDYFHTDNYDGSTGDAKRVLEEISGTKVVGFRSPRMSGANNKQLKAEGYKYNSSMNPTYLPGRYNHLKEPRSTHIVDDVIQLPSSVSARFRVPLFWLALHNLPLFIYKSLCKGAVKRDGHLNIYFHPWEFCDSLHESQLKMPYIIKHNSGETLVKRLENLIEYFKKKGYEFNTISSYLDCGK